VAYSLCNFGEKNVYVITYEMKNVKKKEIKWIKWMLQRMTSRKFGNEKGHLRFSSCALFTNAYALHLKSNLVRIKSFQSCEVKHSIK
jgi:hypothetical protein